MANLNPTTKNCLNWFYQHPGQIMHYADIAEAIGQTKENVNAACVRMVNVHPEFGVERTSTGYYVFRGSIPEKIVSKPTPPQMYEFVGMSKTNGRIMVRDENGYLYWLEEM